LLDFAFYVVALAALTATLARPAAAYEKRFNCGDTLASYIDARGHLFIDDVPYTAQNGAGYIGGWDAPYDTWKPIGGTPDERLYKRYHAGSSGLPLNEYRFDVPNGTYIVRLHFADTVNHGPGIGKFSIAIEGQPALSNFDIYAQVRDHYAVLYTFPVTVSDGQLNVAFTLIRTLVQINAIEVWSATPDAISPAVPASLAVSGCYGRILLDWADNDEEDLAGYHVERATSPNGPWQRLTATIGRLSRFEDANALPTGLYYYRVLAADVWGNESAAGDPGSGTVRLDAETDLDIYRITIDPGVWETLNLNVGSDTYYPANFTYNNQTWTNVGVRYRGNTSRDVSKKSWKIKFDKFVTNQEFLDGQNELNLDSTFGERTLLREKLASDYCELVEVPDFDSRHAQLRVNGEYFGVYTTPENVDRRWLRKLGFDDSGSLYKAELNAYMQVMPDTAAYMAAYSKQTNEATGYADLIQFIELVNATPADQIYHVLSGGQIRFDIESFINYNAAMVALSTDSFFGRNYFLYHDLLTNTWTYLPDDLDTTFGHRRIFAQDVVPNLDPLYGSSNILIMKLQQSPHVKRRIFERVLEMMDEEMTPGRMAPVVDSTFALMRADAQVDWRKWGWENPAWTDGGANEIKDYIPARQSDLSAVAEPLPERDHGRQRLGRRRRDGRVRGLDRDRESRDHGREPRWLPPDRRPGDPDQVGDPRHHACPRRPHRFLVRRGTARGADPHELPAREDRRVRGALRAGHGRAAAHRHQELRPADQGCVLRAPPRWRLRLGPHGHADAVDGERRGHEPAAGHHERGAPAGVPRAQRGGARHRPHRGRERRRLGERLLPARHGLPRDPDVRRRHQRRSRRR
jgi:hypothetical protein